VSSRPGEPSAGFRSSRRCWCRRCARTPRAAAAEMLRVPSTLVRYSCPARAPRAGSRPRHETAPRSRPARARARRCRPDRPATISTGKPADCGGPSPCAPARAPASPRSKSPGDRRAHEARRAGDQRSHDADAVREKHSQRAHARHGGQRAARGPIASRQPDQRRQIGGRACQCADQPPELQMTGAVGGRRDRPRQHVPGPVDDHSHGDERHAGDAPGRHARRPDFPCPRPPPRFRGRARPCPRRCDRPRTAEQPAAATGPCARARTEPLAPMPRRDESSAVEPITRSAGRWPRQQRRIQPAGHAPARQRAGAGLDQRARRARRRHSPCRSRPAACRRPACRGACASRRMGPQVACLSRQCADDADSFNERLRSRVSVAIRRQRPEREIGAVAVILQIEHAREARRREAGSLHSPSACCVRSRYRCRAHGAEAASPAASSPSSAQAV
jgi:hypothetical protein